MLNRNQPFSGNSRINSWLSPVRDPKVYETTKITTFSSRSIQSPSPRAEILGNVRESIISHIKHQNICLENKIKEREQLQKSQGFTAREGLLSASVKTHIHSNSKSPSNNKLVNFKFDSIGFMEKIMKRVPNENQEQTSKNLDDVQFAQLDEVFAKVKELFDDHNRKEKMWRWEKTQMMRKIEFLEQKIKDLGNQPYE
jgi:hypothetical protein